MESMLLMLGLSVLAVPALLVLALVGLAKLKQRVAMLEEEVGRLRTLEASRPVERPAAAQATGTAAAGPAGLAAPPLPPAMPPASPPPPPSPAPQPAPAQAARAATTGATAPRRERARPDAASRFVARVKRWFTEGNVPVKVGVLVLLAGVAALLKYASDQGWLSLPMSLRLAGIAAVALAALAFAWRKRDSHRSFALAVQGGAIGVLLLVVYAAFRLHGLLPAGVAFATSVALVAALGVLAVLQNSRTLAVLGILAGFMAPIWLSTGSGNHVVLFSYYALLNAAIFAIAWLRPWRELNLLGWIFTWGIGVTWGVLAYAPSKFASTEPFLLLFFAFYLALPLLYARRQAPGRRGVVDGCLLFGTPLVAFVLQAGLLEGDGKKLAGCALALAAIYAVLAWWQRRGPHAVLAEAYTLLAAGFATLAVPLALTARATAAVFAIEGAGLVWLGLRTGRRLPRWSGTALQLAAAVAFLVGFGSMPVDPQPLLNPVFAGALLIAIAGFASAWWLQGGGRSGNALPAYGWGLVWWAGAIIGEIAGHVSAPLRPDAMIAAAALTALLAAQAHRWRATPALVLTVLGSFAVVAVLAFAQLGARGQPLAGWGAAAWLLFAAFGLRSLVCLRRDGGLPAVWAQSAWWLTWALLLSLSAFEFARSQELGGGWRLALPALPWLALFAVQLFRWPWLRPPLGTAFDAARGPFTALVLVVVGYGWLVALRAPGASAPLPWVPLLNPLDLAQLAALVLVACWLWSPWAPVDLARRRVALVSAAGFLLVTCITLRGVHHWGGVAWGESMWSTALAQTALTLVWSVLGVAGWIGGSRRGQRVLWLAGAVLMGVVLAKLVLFDRRYLGDLFGIGSFIAYGLLCTAVGWFAPAPPRAEGGDAGGADEDDGAAAERS